MVLVLMIIKRSDTEILLKAFQMKLYVKSDGEEAEN
jgi:hypothetical protein